MDSKNSPITVISFSPSADAELNRWILKYYGLAFVEKRHAPPFFFLIRKFYSGNSLVLCRTGDKTLDGVRTIIEHFDTLADSDKKLIPDSFVHNMDASWQRYNSDLGGAVVTWAYSNLLPHKEIMIRPLSLGSPWHERFFVKHFYNIPKNLIWKVQKLSKYAADEAFKEIQRIFSEVDSLLADGRKYLYGERMTLADFAFVVSGAPLVLPAGYGGDQYEQGPIPTFEQFPKELQEIISNMRQTPAGKFILRMYAEERYPA